MAIWKSAWIKDGDSFEKIDISARWHNKLRDWMYAATCYGYDLHSAVTYIESKRTVVVMKKIEGKYRKMNEYMTRPDEA